MAAYQEDSRQLEELRTGDFSSIRREMAEIFTEGGPPVVPVNIVDRVCKETAELYVRPPRRVFSGVRKAQASALESLLEVIGWQQLMQESAERAVGHNAIVLSVEPGRRVGEPCIQTWLPHQVSVIFEDPSRVVLPIHEADRVEIRVPAQVEQRQGSATVLFGTRIYTPTEAYLKTPSGQEIPLLGTSKVHGLGYIPLVGMRRVSPREGLWLPSLPYDLLCVAVALCMGISDMHHIARYQIHTEEHWIGVDADRAAADQPTGPDYVHAVSIDDPDRLTHEVVERDPKLEKYRMVLEFTAEQFAANRSMSRSALVQSTGITGDAKAEERADQERERLRMEQMCKRFENDALRLLCDVMHATTSEPMFAEAMRPAVSLDYHYVIPRGNRLQAAQAEAILIEQDRTSPAELVSRDEGVSLEEARERVSERRAVRLANTPTPGPTPGIDRLEADNG